MAEERNRGPIRSREAGDGNEKAWHEVEKQLNDLTAAAVALALCQWQDRIDDEDGDDDEEDHPQGDGDDFQPRRDFASWQNPPRSMNRAFRAKWGDWHRRNVVVRILACPPKLSSAKNLAQNSCRFRFLRLASERVEF